jgi:two-component system, NarL family, nitrate/nitrite response regulator NarL
MSIVHLAHVMTGHHVMAGHHMMWYLSIAAPAQIRLFVVSGVRLLREGLARSLRRRRPADVALIGCTGFAEAERAGISELRPDVILVDLSNHEGLAATKTLRSLSPASKLIAFSVADTVEDVFSCASAGFSGYVTREAGADELLCAVRAARDGRMNCSPHIAAALFNHLADRLSPPSPANGAFLLTVRERQVLMLSNEGWSNKEIGRRLQISPATVKNHIHSILQKLKVKRRGQAAARMRDQGANP